MIEIIKNRARWNEELARVEQIDFYHTYDYHHISKNPGETPILIKYQEGDNALLLPLLIRDIDNSDYRDATSVYGYAGILEINLNDEFNKADFQKKLKAFFLENRIITIFSRLHPFMAYQEQLLDGMGTILTLGKVVYIDLSTTLENQRAQFNRRLKTYLNKARKTCSIVESDCKSDLDTFVYLYHENMRRVDAAQSYFFDRNYFHQLVNSKDFTTKLMLCIHNETQKIVGGALFIKKGDFVQFHLSGLDEAHFDLNAIKLTIDEMRIASSNKHFKYLNLGGGRGSDEDSLFAFKRSFSKQFKDFKIWKYVVDENIYRKLVEEHFNSPLEMVNATTSFFPAYRASKESMVNS